MPRGALQLEKFCVPGGGPDQLNRCKEAAAGSMLTCSSNWKIAASFPGTIHRDFYHLGAAHEFFFNLRVFIKE